MSTVGSSVSDMLVTVKSREIQRGISAEMRGDKPGAATHLLAAGHLELVLANDYGQAGEDDLAMRSRLSAASCFWRGGQITRARELFNELLHEYPREKKTIKHVLAELEQRRS